MKQLTNTSRRKYCGREDLLDKNAVESPINSHQTTGASQPTIYTNTQSVGFLVTSSIQVTTVFTII